MKNIMNSNIIINFIIIINCNIIIKKWVYCDANLPADPFGTYIIW